MNFSADAWVRTESRAGRTTRDVGPLALATLLRPGSNTTTSIALPSDTLRWQVAYKVRSASLRHRVVSRIPDKWRLRLYPLYVRLLPDQQDREQEIRSALFESPHEPPPVDGGTPLLFGSEALWPASTEAERPPPSQF